MSEDRRLIEDFIPIKEISVESAREKSIRKGHISTLHLWWARRPLVACRAAVFASLVAAPENHQKRSAYKKQMIELCQWKAGEDTLKKARKAIAEAQKKRLGLPEDTKLEDVPPPKVLDMFAGGGAIPLEALRLGCETYAVDLNPVAHIIELCTLVYPQKYGKKLADEVETWGNWVIERVRAEIGDLYPNIKVGESLEKKQEQMELLEQKQTQLGLSFRKELTPVAYLWTRTVKCPNPACGADVPLVRQSWLCKKNKKYVALKVISNHQTKRVEFEVVEATTAKDLGFDPSSGSSRGTSTCRHCGTTVDVKQIKKEGKVGQVDQQLMAIVCTTPGQQGKTYLSATDYLQYIPDEKAILERLEKLCDETGLTTPDEPLPPIGTLGFRVQAYGLLQWKDLFSPRQLLSLMTFVKWVRKAHDELLAQGYDEEFAKAIATYLALMINRVADRASTLCRYDPTPTQSGINNTFGRQALPMVWDFGEGCPIGNSSGSASTSLPWITNFIRQENQNSNFANVQRSSSMSMAIETNSLDAVITDPPYFDSVPYADLSDFFYVWLKRSVGHLYPQHFTAKLTPKKKEAIMEPTRHGGDKKAASAAYEGMMHDAFKEANRILKIDGIMAVVYAHKTTSGWSTLIDSLRRAGFVITEAWPLDTEMGARLRGQNSAALASSIFLISRKRTTSEIGDYAMDVQPQLREIIQSRVKTLMEEGISGADLVIACVGAGLRAYTQFDSVELPNGEELDANTFLNEVQKEVAETILREVLGCDSKGVSQIDKITQYYILARYEYGEAEVAFDEANTLAKGVGVELDGAGGLTDGKTALVQKTKNKVQLRNYTDRGSDEKLGTFDPKETLTPASLIDILHRLLWLAEHKPAKISDYIAIAQPDSSQLRLVAQALSGRALTPNAGEEMTAQRTPEQQAIDTLLASWKRTIEENLFTQKK
ncbi:DUF1156 domain-containing protein [[Limnothrix rosea] IAM M-220]|uniref:DUF1156 domain-containing protein n=1 Tax=[Limnothrix rosea] IAM M-220 TaxID=454133 RepID=UPI000968DB96|nr:DUF1156 domain-containing protein [[Limnothrix rosea] IAM M-220]OKH17695.1 hypothetical protein NIES208_08560 [[Limnothrix rosea] IAM M-220]